MKEILHYLFEYKTLTQSEARDILKNIAQGQYNPSQIASFLTVFMMRSITVEELQGFKEAMLELCIPLEISEFDPMDVCGTGGDGKNTFNISTLVTFVIAAAGVKVAKHGNYGVSSVSGSSNILEYFGYKFSNDTGVLKSSLEETGICFMHAPLFHPAMKNVAPIRKELGVKTFFNMLGPMVNPAFPRKQLVGVFSLELARLYSYLYQKSNKKFCILHSLDGYDEISLTGNFKAITHDKEEVLQPSDLQLGSYSQEDLFGGDTVEEAAKIFLDILQNKGSVAQKEIVSVNAAFALQCAGQAPNLEEGLSIAKEMLESGKAYATFKKLTQNSMN